jgi:hypothetical protein
MLFLIEYDRSRGEIISLRTYPDTERDTAGEDRLSIELDLRGTGIEREIVLLEAASKEALMKTHRRYFESLTALAKAS